MNCDLCNGNIIVETGPHIFRSKPLGEVVVPNVTYEKCQQCGETLLSPEMARHIGEFVRDEEEAALLNLPANDLIAAQDAATILGISKQAFSKNRKIHRGFIYSIKIGDRKFYSKQSTELFAETNDGRFRLSIPANPESTTYVIVQVPTPQAESSIYTDTVNQSTTSDTWGPDDYYLTMESNDAYR